MAPSDAELVRGSLAGDPAAIRGLVERFQADVYGLCVRMLRHAHDAEDASQEVFLRVFRSLKRWDSTRPLRPWVLGITVNRCRTRLSRKGNRITLVDDLSDAPAREPPRGDEGEVASAVRVAVDALRADYKAVFVLFHEQGRSYEEIAGAIDRPVGTVKTWLHRARALILEHLKKLNLVSETAE